MKRNYKTILVLVILVGLLLTACGRSNETPAEPNTGNNTNMTEPSTPQAPNATDESTEPQAPAGQTTQSMVDTMLEKVEQPSLMDLPEDMVADMYHLDPALLEEYTIRTPMMNVKSNEIAILKVKDAKDVPTVEEAVKQRATDVQTQFERYLPDQYENAKNYKVVTKDNYVLFVISEEADKLVNEFNSFFQ